MKKTYRIKYLQQIFTFGIATILFASCSDFLEEEPISQVSDETFWVNGTNANSSIVGGYAELRKALNSGLAYYSYGDLPTDIFSKERDIADYKEVMKVNWGVAVEAALTDNPMYKLRNFSLFYATIQQANLCLEHIPEIPKEKFDEYDVQYNQFMGEAYFIRAFSYFYMTRVWGDVPIVDETNSDKVDLKNYARSDKEDVLAKAISDCNTALTYLDWDYSDSEDKAVRANAGAAWSLLAHMYAWGGNYEACEKACEKVTEKAYYTYVDRNNYLDVFDGQSSESIFEISQNSENEARAGWYSSLVWYLLRGEYLMPRKDEKQTLWPVDTLTLRQTLFNDANDLRRINGFDEFSDPWPIILKHSNITYTSPSSPLDINNIVVFRLAGITLLKAEAQAAQKKYGLARTTLNSVRSLADLANSEVTDEKLFEAIIEERGRELYMEGHRFYDLVRLAREKGVYKFGSDDSNKISKREFEEGKFYWPIQPTLIETNPLLIQTPYWQSEVE